MDRQRGRHDGSSTSRAPSLTPGRVSRCHGTLPCIMLEKLRLGLKTPRNKDFCEVIVGVRLDPFHDIFVERVFSHHPSQSDDGCDHPVDDSRL